MLDVHSLSQSFEFRRSDDHSEKFEEKGSFCLSRQIRHFLQSNFDGRPDFKRVMCLFGLCNNFWSWAQNLHGTGAVHFVRTATAQQFFVHNSDRPADLGIGPRFEFCLEGHLFCEMDTRPKRHFSRRSPIYSLTRWIYGLPTTQKTIFFDDSTLKEKTRKKRENRSLTFF